MPSAPGASSHGGSAKCFVDCVLHAGSSQLGLRRRQGGLVNVDQVLSHRRSIYRGPGVYRRRKFRAPRRSLSCNGRHVSGPEIWPQCLAGQCGDSTPKAVVTPSPTPRCSCPRQLKPAVFMEPIVGDGDEPMTLRHPSEIENRRPLAGGFVCHLGAVGSPGALKMIRSHPQAVLAKRSSPKDPLHRSRQAQPLRRDSHSTSRGAAWLGDGVWASSSACLAWKLRTRSRLTAATVTGRSCAATRSVARPTSAIRDATHLDAKPHRVR